MKKLFLISTSILVLFTGIAKSEIVVDSDKISDLSLNVYSNIALVKETRELNVPSGNSLLLFNNIAEQIKPESLIVNANGVVIKGQNYNYPMLSPDNLAKINIGKIVKTAIWDEAKGKNIYDKARIIDVYNGKPVLQFGYGVEFEYPGRIIWDSVPENMKTEPSLTLNVSAQEAGDKSLSLMYLTGGVQWKANYVAELVNENEMNLKSWVSIYNNSGVDFDNAKLQLVAGDANVMQQSIMRPMMLKASRAMDATTNQIMNNEMVGDYYIYSLPEKISVANNQTKQFSLLSKDNIKYKKEYKLVSPLYLNATMSTADFKKQSAETFVKITNNEEANLGVALPQGVIRFYDYDGNGNILFVGENNFAKMAVGEDSEINIGKSFDVVASGKIININKIADNTFEAEVNVSFMNAKKHPVNIVFEQKIFDDWNIVSENIKGAKYDANTMKWNVNVQAMGSMMLNFKVRIMKQNA